MRSTRLVLGSLAALASAALFGTASASAAVVAPSWTADQTGSAYTQTIAFQGQQQGVAVPGLNADVILSLDSVSKDQATWSFDFEVKNNVVAPVHAALIRSFSFAPQGVVSSITLNEEAEDVGQLSPKSDGDDGQIVCIDTNKCSFRYDTGIAKGEIGSGSFSFTVATPVNQMTLTDLKLGFSDIVVEGGSASNISSGGSAVGLAISTQQTPGVTPSAAPEPATWALMMVAVGGMGGALRARRRQAVVA